MAEVIKVLKSTINHVQVAGDLSQISFGPGVIHAITSNLCIPNCKVGGGYVTVLLKLAGKSIKLVQSTNGSDPDPSSRHLNLSACGWLSITSLYMKVMEVEVVE